jgi:hypothetical protein
VQQAQEPSPRAGVEASADDRSAADTFRPAGEGSSTGLGGLTGAAGLPAPLTELDPFPGMLVGNVRILHRIGEGGMGRVYEGHQQEPSRRVAVKLLRPVFVTDEARRRFKQEADILGQLTHPGIARIYAAGTCEVLGTSVPYLVMELVEHARTITAHAAAARLDVAARVALLAEACDAVAASHARGIVHRDLKPGNILVDAAGRPRVIDFGVARWHEAAAAEGLTGSGQFVGTLRYTSPEQLAADGGPAGAQSDVYSLGVILHELLTGRPPLDLEKCSAAEADHVVRTRVPPPIRRLNPDVPLHVERVVARCLAIDPAARFPDAAGLATALRDPGTGVGRRPLGRRLVVAGALGLPVAAAAAWGLLRGAGPAEMTVRFDLQSPPEGLLVRAAEARINRESFGASMYWAPERPGVWAEIVYRIRAPFPIADASFADLRVDAWNAHAEVTFDPLAEAHLDVSPDGVRWTALAGTSPTSGPSRDDRAAVAAVRGSRAVFLRARLFESRSFARNRVHYAQFLRSEPALGRVPSLTLYRVGQGARRETGR